MVATAVAEVSGERYVHDPIHESECAPLFLHKRREPSRNRRIQVHRPTGIGGTGVHVQRENEMLLGLAINQRIEEERSGSEIDDRRTNDANWTDVPAGKTRSYRGANIG